MAPLSIQLFMEVIHNSSLSLILHWRKPPPFTHIYSITKSHGFYLLNFFLIHPLLSIPSAMISTFIWITAMVSQLVFCLSSIHSPHCCQIDLCITCDYFITHLENSSVVSHFLQEKVQNFLNMPIGPLMIWPLSACTGFRHPQTISGQANKHLTVFWKPTFFLHLGLCACYFLHLKLLFIPSLNPVNF